MSTVAVVGLGKLGLPIAVALAAKGLRVHGVDVDAGRVAELEASRCPIPEPRVAELLTEAGARFDASTDTAAAVADADVVMVFVPTPSREDGSFSIDLALEACAAIGAAMRADDRYRVIVVNSTVSPGSTMSEIREAIEAASGKALGEGFGLAYSPEFVALGNVVGNFLRPDVVLIGQSDDRAGDALEAIYMKVCENTPPVVRMDVVNAEIAKLAVNTYVTTKIAFANMLAEMCGRVPGGDVDAVTAALGMDSRIGSRYLTGGLGYGGPCFPRDNRALAQFAHSVGVGAPIPEATDAANVAHGEEVVAQVRSTVGAGADVAILGLAYRAGTDVIDESPGIALAEALGSDGVTVKVFDPLAMDAAAKRLAQRVTFARSVGECVADVDAVIVAMPWPGLERDLYETLGASRRSVVVIDCWRSLDPAALPGSARYSAIGVAPADGS
jgi:UDPglucose 6-dehydrogenase